MSKNTWSNFTRKIYIKAPPGKIYWHWATSKGIEAWFLRSADFKDQNDLKRGHEELTQAGDQYRWFWHHWAEAGTGTIEEANGRNFLSFTFADTQVSINLQQEEELTLLTLTQDRIPTDDESKMNLYYGCGTGWSFWLTNLKAYLEHDVVLHHTETDMMGKHSGFEFVNM